VSGIELLKNVRANEELGKTAFVMVTSESENHQVAEAIESGVDQYILKPFSTESFVSKLKTATKKRPF
jgi:two-component system chemotaxis response regulator CheY